MADDDAESPSSKRPADSGPPIPLVAQPRARKGPVLELAPSEAEVENPPSVVSMDDLVSSDERTSVLSVDDLLGALETTDENPPLSEDAEPLMLKRENMHHSAAPPPVPRKATVTEPPQRRSSPPPLPRLAPEPSPIAAEAAPPAVAPRPKPGSLPPVVPPPLPPAAPPNLPPLLPAVTAPHLPPPPPHKRASIRPVPAPRARSGNAPPPLPQSATRGPVLELLQARITSLDAAQDRVALGRALAERAVLEELMGEGSMAVASARAALEKHPALPAMHALLRRRLHARGAADALLEHVDAELAQAGDGSLRTSLLAERARLLWADGRPADALVAWSHVLAHEPRHAAGLRGKEAILASSERAGAADWEAEADHLGVMAEAYVDAPGMAAWLEVERSTILESRLGRVDAARRALTRALSLAPGVGPSRRAMVRHVVRHGDASALVDLLDEEGRIEADPSRAARLELEAATVARLATHDAARAIVLLERAAGRAPTAPSVDLRVLDDLVRLLEAAGRRHDAVRWRRAELGLLESPHERAHALVLLARAAEQAGDLDAAIADLEATLKDRPDAATVAQLDRVLARAGRHAPRVALWVREAARAGGPARRVASLMTAAKIAERDLGLPDEAVVHLQAAWTTTPGHPAVLEALTRLLARPTKDPEARARMELYTRAAEVAGDAGQRVAYLEKVALLAEETLGDLARATAAYEAILAMEPARVGALLGLARAAARAGHDRTLSKALLAQASVARSEPEALDLKTRAATAVARLDPALALAMATEVLAADPAHAEARGLVIRLHEDAERWDLVARALEESVARADADERLGLLLRLAEVDEVHRKLPATALATLRRARDGDPDDPRVAAAIARVLATLGDPRALREAHEQLASGAPRDEERARHLVRVAELSEHALADDTNALAAYEEALRAAPGDAMIADRLERVRVRAPGGRPAHPLDRALELVTAGEDRALAGALLAPLVGRGAEGLPALRLLERLHRRAEAWAPLADILAQEADALRGSRPELGALWALAELEEWRVDSNPGRTTYARILGLAPDDPEALSATVRTRFGDAIGGDEPARRAVMDALRHRAELESGSERAATQQMLAHLLEGREGDANEGAATEALERYRDVLSIDASSVTAAWGLRRHAHQLGRTAEAVEAATILADLALEPKARARHYFEAAELVHGASDGARLGDGAARREREVSLLELAVTADPDWVAAASALIDASAGRDQPDALLGVLRAALERASEAEAVIFLGTSAARVAREELRDVGVATRAMERVRDVAPTHAPSLLALAELYLAQRAWPEAVAALEAVVARSEEDDPRLAALFALGTVYDKVLARPDEHERVLRAALAIQPASPRALRGLIDQLRAKEAPPGAAERTAAAREIVPLLHRLAKSETEPKRQCDAFLEVAELEVEVGERGAAERSLIEAIVHFPENARAFARLAAFFRSAAGLDAPGYARALQQLIARGRESGLTDARWFAALGQLEVDTLQRLHEGVAHLEWAVQLDPALHETRFELADAHARTGARDLAIRGLLSLLVPDPRPLASLSDAGVALALLDRLLEQDKRPDEAVAISELRATLGDLEPGRADWLKTRRLPPLEEHHTPLGRTTLVEDVLPKVGRHVLLEVAVASTGLDSKLLRTNLAELGVQARDRLGARSGHPLRALFDRVNAALGVDELELASSPVVDRVRVVVQDAPWVLVPASFEALPEAVQVAALARASARALLGVPWLMELREAAIIGWLVAVARQVAPGYGAEDRDAIPPEAQTYEPLVARTIGRRQRKLLEGLGPHLELREGRLPDRSAFLRALEQCTARAAYLVAGDLLATARAVALDDPHLREALATPGLPALNALLSHAVTGDVARFALTPEATTLRRRLGSAWAR